MGVIPNPKMAFIFPISCILVLIFPNFMIYFPSDLYKSDWKLQGNTNTQLKLLCRASYTGKWGGIDIIYLHDLPLSRVCNTQRNFSIVYQNF